MFICFDRTPTCDRQTDGHRVIASTRPLSIYCAAKRRSDNVRSVPSAAVLAEAPLSNISCHVQVDRSARDAIIETVVVKSQSEATTGTSVGVLADELWNGLKLHEWIATKY